MKIAVLLSGGVDSSVALRLLSERDDVELTAFYLKIWLEEELTSLGDCPWEDDLHYARAVCRDFSIPLEVVPLQREYHDRVVSYTIDELRAGRTPSPDVMCNQRVKFGAFVEAIGGEFDRIASGHYAQTQEREGQTFLLRAKDPSKDQTYFLSHLHQEQVARCVFPIGPYLKSEVRDMAKRFALPNEQRRDSQGICFLGKIPYNDFVQFHLGEQEGEIRELESDRVLGSHRGFWFHTIGQRRGLGLHGGPWFVIRKDLERNIIYVSHRESFESEARDRFGVESLHWIAQPPSTEQLTVKIRHSEDSYPCRLQFDGDVGEVALDGRDQGVASGQFAVFYQEEACLGGGVIR